MPVKSLWKWRKPQKFIRGSSRGTKKGTGKGCSGGGKSKGKR